MRFNKVKHRALCFDWSNPRYEYRLVEEFTESSPAEKNLGILIDKKLAHMSPHCVFATQKGKQHPELHWKWDGQQGVQGDHPPLLCPSEDPAPRSGAPSTRTTWSCWNKFRDHKDDQRGGTPVLWEKAEGSRLFQPTEEEDLGRSYCCLPVPGRELINGWETHFLHGLIIIEQRRMVLF